MIKHTYTNITGYVLTDRKNSCSTYFVSHLRPGGRDVFFLLFFSAFFVECFDTLFSILSVKLFNNAEHTYCFRNIMLCMYVFSDVRLWLFADMNITSCLHLQLFYSQPTYTHINQLYQTLTELRQRVSAVTPRRYWLFRVLSKLLTHGNPDTGAHIFFTTLRSTM